MKTKKNFNNITGILLLDKPASMTSNHALQIIKRLYNADKAGHTGSLDPLATGMLPICFGQATKFAQFLLDTDKFYSVTARLGVKTATGDAEGAIISESSVPQFSDAELEKVLQKFRGNIEQIPSMYSAIKYKGQPLYKLAREGLVVKREKRPVTIHSLDVVRRGGDQIEFLVHSSKGTYIRTLIEDIGGELKCGAHVSELRRLAVGHYREEQMLKLIDLEQIADAGETAALMSRLLPLESLFSGWQPIRVTELIAFYLRQGQAVIFPNVKTQGLVQLQLKDGRFLGIGEVLSDGKIAPRKLINNN